MASDELKMRENPKWIRGFRNGRVVVDSRNTLFVWEHEYYPAWYVPVGDVAADIVATDSTFEGGSRGAGTMVDLQVEDVVISSAG